MLKSGDFKILIFPSILFLLVLLFTIFKIHGSSIGVYNQIFDGADFKDPDLIAGKLRPIRSDEWAVQTPFAISQSQNNFSPENKFTNDQKVYFFTDIPNRDLSTIFKPYNFSFLVMPLENAFAFKWFIRGFLLILASYLLLQKLYKNYFLSVTGSLIIFFSPFIQWWYSVSAVETVSYGLFILYFFLQVLEFKTKKSLLVNSVFLIYFLLCFLFILYPPFQISVGLFILFLTIGLIKKTPQILKKDRLKEITIPFLLIGIFLILTCSYFISVNTQTLNLIRNTEYPGQRQIFWADIPLHDFFAGFFNYKLLENGNIKDGNLVNGSELASFIMLFPFLILFIFLSRTKRDPVINSLIIFFSICSFWVLLQTQIFVSIFATLGIPNVGWFLKGTIDFIYSLFLINLVPQKRLILGIGLANLFLVFNFLYRDNEKYKIKLRAIPIAILGFAVFAYTGFSTVKNDSRFFISNTELISGALLVYFLLLLLFFRFKKTFLIFLLTVLIFSSATVNPLYRGLKVVTESKLSQSLLSYKLNYPDKKFINYDNWLLSNYLAANGISVLFGTHFYPQFEIWKEFDPLEKYKKIYNRYAHVEVKETDEKSPDIFLSQADLIKIRIDPCDRRLDKFNVGYVIFEKPVYYSCLELDKKVNFTGKSIYIYERVE